MENGKGDRNRTYGVAYRDGWDRVFSQKGEVMKLSKSQEHVVDRMRSGWGLGSSISMSGDSNLAWLQEGGVGRGGDMEKVRWDTFQALLRKGVITRKGHCFPAVKYKLVETEG